MTREAVGRRAAAPVAAVGAVVLAAGQSSRMGANKVLLVLDGESLVRRAARRALEAGLSPVVVVLGRDAERAAEEVASLACLPVVNPRFADGMATSIRCGVESLPEEVEAAVMLLADQPLVTEEHIRAVRDAYVRSRTPLVVSDYDGVQAPPILYRRDLFPELLAAQGDSCRKRVVRRHLADAVLLPLPAACLADVDSPDDYARMLDGLRTRRPGAGAPGS